MDGEVLIVDEHTGRMLAGRRYNEGMHQAIEAKEGVEIKRGEPDPRHDHPAELLPPLRQALRHDRHGHDRGRRVRQDLQARRRADPDQQADDPHRPGRPRLPHRGGEVRRRRRRHRRAAREGPAGPGRHRVGREVRAPLRSCCASAASRTRCSTPSSTRDEAKIVAHGRPQGRGHRRHQHGRPRHRHHARRQPPSSSPTAELRERGPRPGRDARGVRGRLARGARAGQGRRSPPSTTRSRELGGLYVARHRAARVAPHRQPAARPLRPPGRPGRVPVLPVARGRADAAVQVRLGRPRADHALKIPDDVPIENKLVTDADRQRAGPGRGAELRDPQERPQVRRGDEPPAQVIYAERRRVLEGADLHEQIRTFIDDVVEGYVDGATAEGFAEEWDLDALWTALRQLYPVSLDARRGRRGRPAAATA